MKLNVCHLAGSLLHRKLIGVFFKRLYAAKSTWQSGIMSPCQIRNFSRHCQKHRARSLKFSPLLTFGSIFTAGIYVAYSLKDIDIRKKMTGQVNRVANHNLSLSKKLIKKLETYRDVKRERKNGHTIRDTKAVDGESETSLTWEEVSEKSLASIVKVESIKRPFLVDSLTLVLNQKIGFICQRGLVLTDSSIARGGNNDFLVTFNNGRTFYGRIPFHDLKNFCNTFALIEFDGGHDIPPLSFKTDQGDSPALMDVLVYKLDGVSSEDDKVLSSVRAALNTMTTSPKTVIVHGGGRPEQQTSNNIKRGANSWADLVRALQNRIASITLSKPIVNDNACRDSPIIDQNCNVVGILKTCDRHGTVALPIGRLKTFLEKYSLMKIGIVCVPLNPRLETKMNTLNSGTSPKQVESQAGGHLVCTVERNSISDKCGIKPGDIITHVNNEPLHNVIYLALELKSDRKIKVRVRRGPISEEIILKF